MNNITYLTIEKLKNITTISKNVDVALLEPFIETSQEMDIVPVLGDALHNELISRLENNTLTGNSLTLVNNYIIPAAAWSTFYQSSIFLWVKIMNKGVVKQNGENSQSIDKDDLAIFRQGIKEKSVFYLNKLIKYLDDNYILYSNYRSNDEERPSKGNSSGIYLGGINHRIDDYNDNNYKYWK